MTLQDDRARPWFQPLVPTEQPHTDTRGDAGPLTTRIQGELLPPPAEAKPAPAPERLEVTQPFIPAIREQTPEFAKRLNPDPPETSKQNTPQAPPSRRPTPSADDSSTAAEPAAAPPASGPEPAPVSSPPKRRSLARRVVRRIIGPDLLRKDPAPKKKR